MRLKILKNLIGKGGIKGIVINLLVSAAIGYITKKLSENASKQEIIDTLRSSSSDWDEIFNRMDKDAMEEFIRRILRELK